MTQINSDAETLYWFLCEGVPYFITNSMQILGIAVVMVTIHPGLALSVLIPLPVIGGVYIATLRLFRRLYAENHSHHSRFNAAVSDVLGGMRVVKAFSREKTEVTRFHEKSKALSKSKLKIDIRNHTVFPLFAPQAYLRD